MTSLILLPEIRVADHPDRLIVISPWLTAGRARSLAIEAVRLARQAAPKINGAGARRLQPVYGKGVAGIRWQDAYMLYIDHGTAPFTMRSLAGKTIPMWVEDPTGVERERNPKAKVRTTADGRVQVLIFRRAAALGQRTTKNGASKPASYPGAPGRIARREAAAPWTTPGRRGGAIAAGNVGVRWRHPGIVGRQFMNHGLAIASQRAGLVADRAYLADSLWRARTGELR